MNQKAETNPTMTVVEINREIARLEDLRAEAERAERLLMMQQNYERAVELLGTLVDSLRVLEETGYLPPKLREALQDSTGKFNPGMYIKKPSRPR